LSVAKSRSAGEDVVPHNMSQIKTEKEMVTERDGSIGNKTAEKLLLHRHLKEI